MDGKTWGLGRLIRELANIDDLKRIRYSTSHPCDVQDDLIEAHRDVPKLMPHLHLPVQSGSNKILKAMNRKHTIENDLDIIARFREAQPDIECHRISSSDFPGKLMKISKPRISL